MLGMDVQRATREWQAEVDAEMVRLIESGTPPIDAAGQAREIVSRRRAARSNQGKWGDLRELAKAMEAAGH